MKKDIEKNDILDEMSDMAQLGSLVLSCPDDLITDLFKDFLQNLEDK